MHHPTVVHHRPVRRPHGIHASAFSWVPPASSVYGTQKDTLAFGLAAKPQRASPPRQMERAPAGTAKFVICDHTIEQVFRILKHLLATDACQIRSEDAYYGHLVLRLMASLVLYYTSRVLFKGRVTMDEMIFNLKHR